MNRVFYYKGTDWWKGVQLLYLIVLFNGTGLKNCPNTDVFWQFDRGGNRTRDLLFACAMIYHYTNYEVKSVRVFVIIVQQAHTNQRGQGATPPPPNNF